MATRIKLLYDQDLDACSKTEAELLRAGRYAELDLDHPIEGSSR